MYGNCESFGQFVGVIAHGFGIKKIILATSDNYSTYDDSTFRKISADKYDIVDGNTRMLAVQDTDIIRMLVVK